MSHPRRLLWAGIGKEAADSAKELEQKADKAESAWGGVTIVTAIYLSTRALVLAIDRHQHATEIKLQRIANQLARHPEEKPDVSG